MEEQDAITQRSEATEKEGRAALDSLNKKDFQELKAFSNPPQAVKDAFSCVMIMNDKPVDWGSSKKAMANPTQFVEDLKQFDVKKVTAKNLKKVKTVLEDETLTPENLAHKSKAIVELMVWIRACVFIIENQNEDTIANLQRQIEEVNGEKAKLEEEYARL